MIIVESLRYVANRYYCNMLYEYCLCNRFGAWERALSGENAAGTCCTLFMSTSYLTRFLFQEGHRRRFFLAIIIAAASI